MSHTPPRLQDLLDEAAETSDELSVLPKEPVPRGKILERIEADLAREREVLKYERKEAPHEI